MYRVMLIGAGQLGSRHLQGLARAGMALDIAVVDPSAASRETARQRYEEVAALSQDVSVTFHESVEMSGVRAADLAIVATGADVRPAVIDDLLARVTMRYLLLEKVVFQSESLFAEKTRALEGAGVSTWVNCPRRLYPFYVALAHDLAGRTPMVMEVTGSDWGMGCNALHFADLFAFLTADPELREESSTFDSILRESKRKGFYELTGTMVLSNGCGTLTLQSVEQAGIPLEITVTVAGHRYVISERGGECRHYTDGRAEPEITMFNVPYQSSLTGEVAKELLLTGSCGLTTLGESARHHMALLPAFRRHFSRLTGEEMKNCPIT